MLPRDQRGEACAGGGSSKTKALYIDNYAVFSTDPTAAEDGVECMRKKLLDFGIVSTLDPPDASDYIGFTLQKNSWRPISKKFWLIEGAARYLAFTRDAISGSELERFLGHAMRSTFWASGADCFQSLGRLTLLFAAVIASGSHSGAVRRRS